MAVLGEECSVAVYVCKGLYIVAVFSARCPPPVFSYRPHQLHHTTHHGRPAKPFEYAEQPSRATEERSGTTAFERRGIDI